MKYHQGFVKGVYVSAAAALTLATKSIISQPCPRLTPMTAGPPTCGPSLGCVGDTHEDFDRFELGGV